MSAASRLRHAAGPAAQTWLGADFASFFMDLHDRFGPRVGRLRGAPPADVRDRYERSLAIVSAWIDRYTALDFRSLGSFTRAELEGTR